MALLVKFCKGKKKGGWGGEEERKMMGRKEGELEEGEIRIK